MERQVECVIGNSFLKSEDDQEKIYFLGAERIGKGEWMIKLLFEKNSSFALTPDEVLPVQIGQHPINLPVKVGGCIPFSHHLGNEIEVERGFIISSTDTEFFPIDSITFDKISPAHVELTCEYLEDGGEYPSHIC